MNVNIYHKHKDITITTFIIASRAYLQHLVASTKKDLVPRRGRIGFFRGSVVLVVGQILPGPTGSILPLRGSCRVRAIASVLAFGMQHLVFGTECLLNRWRSWRA